MNIGEMNQRIALLRYEANEWIEDNIIWAKAAVKQSRCVFSQYAVAGFPTWKLIVHRGSWITGENLLRMGNRLLLITDMAAAENENYLELSCGVVEVKRFTYEITETGRDELNRPVVTATADASFEGILTEKYVKHEEAFHAQRYEKEITTGHATQTQVFILMVPKCVKRKTGTALRADGRNYVVTLRHETGGSFNEYELTARSDV